MSITSIRLGSTLNFDGEKERDIVEFIEQLNSSHKTGQFLSCLIRLAFDNPEIVKRGVKTEQSELLSQIDRLGMSETRKKFMTAVNSEITEMKKKVDSIYDMATKMYMLALAGNRLGIEKKSDNTLLANFVLERQLQEINDRLGTNSVNTVFASNKLDKEHEKASEYMEFIINSYKSLFDELRNMCRVEIVQSSEVVKNNEEVESVQEAKEVKTETIEETKTEDTVVEETKNETADTESNNNSAETKSDDIVDFGMDGGFEDLGTFFGV